uniref:LAGLIDADG homing endonuclease n=1 Tax=Knipowitschia caucasica TaxID=637954 RepID=A0AAV2M8H4_KNICA
MTSSPRAHKQQPLRRATYWKYPRRESCGPGAEDGRHRAGSEINATKLSVEAEMTLPATPRLILLGNTFLSAMKWMVSFEGRVAYILEEHLGFADALSVFFGCFYVFNIEYQEPACATLELIQRFFVRINPEEGTKCSAKIGTSRKTGAEVKRKVETVNSRVSSFLCQLTEFEWKNLD